MNEYEGAIGLLWLILIIGLIGFISGRAKNFLKVTKNDGWYIFWSSEQSGVIFLSFVFILIGFMIAGSSAPSGISNIDFIMFILKWTHFSASLFFYLGVIFFLLSWFVVFSNFLPSEYAYGSHDDTEIDDYEKGLHVVIEQYRDLLVQNGYIVVYYGFPMIFEASTKDMAILDASAHGKVCEKYKHAGPPKKWSSDSIKRMYFKHMTSKKIIKEGKELFKKYVNSNEKLLKYQQIQQKINKKQPEEEEQQTKEYKKKWWQDEYTYKRMKKLDEEHQKRMKKLDEEHQKRMQEIHEDHQKIMQDSKNREKSKFKVADYIFDENEKIQFQTDLQKCSAQIVALYEQLEIVDSSTKKEELEQEIIIESQKKTNLERTIIRADKADKIKSDEPNLTTGQFFIWSIFLTITRSIVIICGVFVFILSLFLIKSIFARVRKHAQRNW